MPDLHFLSLHQPRSADLALEAARGLLHPHAAVSPKFFYDALGSRLFDAITELDEYYPTRTEAAIFSRHGAEIAQAVAAAVPTSSTGLTLVDVGAGDGAKAARLFEPLGVQRYVALDISVDYLKAALTALQRQHPQLAMAGVGLDFAQQLVLPAAFADTWLPGPALVFYPGSSIGNFAPDAALALLRQARALARGGGLLIGVDLVKDKALLDAAYDDSLGVTAAFNLNLLRHLNRLLGCDFDLRQWQHLGFYNAEAARIEMHLQARTPQTVGWQGAAGPERRHFAAGERIHTEYSHKWTQEGFAALLRDAGFARTQVWVDERKWFAVCLASG